MFNVAWMSVSAHFCERLTYSRASWWYPEFHIPEERGGAHVTVQQCTVKSHHISFKHNTARGQRLFKAAPKIKDDNDDILLRGLVGERLQVFVFRKLDVWLWTEHTVSVSESKLAQPQEGIKSVGLGHPVLWRKRERGFRLNRLIIFFLILTSVPAGPGGPGGPWRERENKWDKKIQGLSDSSPW